MAGSVEGEAGRGWFGQEQAGAAGVPLPYPRSDAGGRPELAGYQEAAGSAAGRASRRTRSGGATQRFRYGEPLKTGPSLGIDIPSVPGKPTVGSPDGLESLDALPAAAEEGDVSGPLHQSPVGSVETPGDKVVFTPRDTVSGTSGTGERMDPGQESHAELEETSGEAAASTGRQGQLLTTAVGDEQNPSERNRVSPAGTVRDGEENPVNSGGKPAPERETAQRATVGDAPRRGRAPVHSADTLGTRNHTSAQTADQGARSGAKSSLVDEKSAVLRARIIRRKWQPGERMPLAAELATELEIGRTTLLKVLRVLRDEGLVDSRTRGGVYVAGASPDVVRLREAIKIAQATGVENLTKGSSVKIAAFYRDEISSGRIQRGARMLTLKQLQAEHHISERTAQRVHRILAHEGLIVNDKSNVFVGEVPPEPLTPGQMQNRADLDSAENEALTLLEKISGKIKREITSGNWEPGSPIPSWSQLMADYGISRHEASKVHQSLKADGLIVLEKRRMIVRREPGEPQNFGDSSGNQANQPERPAPLYIAITNDLRTKMESGEIARGSRVPSIAQIEIMYHTSHSVAAKVHRDLGRAGLTVADSRGMFFGEFPSDFPEPPRGNSAAERLARNIQAANLPVDTELIVIDLAIIHGVSAVTMRRAIALLEAEGHVRRQGRRSFIANPSILDEA